MWRYEFLKFKFEISKCDFDMFSYVFETKYPMFGNLLETSVQAEILFWKI